MLRLTTLLVPILAVSPAIAADTVPIHIGATLDESLKAVGLFLGTYGLAVFLVVYYAIRLYPEIQKERGEWIRQITILRQLIDPGNRSLTRDQARVVLDLASDAFTDRLKFARSGGYSYRSVARPVGPVSYGNVESVYLFGEEISYEKDSGTSDSGSGLTMLREKELEKIYADIVRAIKNLAGTNKRRTEEFFDEMSEFSQRDTYRLALLRFGSVSLEQIWRAAYEPAVTEWKSTIRDFLDASDRYDVDNARRFLSGHPAWRSKEEEYKSYFAEMKFISGSEYFSEFSALLKSKIEEQLIHFDRVDFTSNLASR